MMVGRRAGGLDEKEVVAADVFFDFDEGFTVWEGGDLGFTESRVEVLGNFLGEGKVGASCEELEHRCVVYRRWVSYSLRMRWASVARAPVVKKKGE